MYQDEDTDTGMPGGGDTGTNTDTGETPSTEEATPSTDDTV